MAYCTECGQGIAEHDRFCPQCGQKVHRPSSLATAPSASTTLPDAVPPSELAEIPATSAPSDLGPPQYGSMFRETGDAPPATVMIEGSGLPVVVLIGVLALVGLSGLTGYWWFARGSAPPAETAARMETEQRVTPDGKGGAETEHGEKPAKAAVAEDRHVERETSSAGRAWTLVVDSTRNVSYWADAAPEPDGRPAVIAPGGALALAWASEFYNGAGADVRVFGPEDDRTPYTLFARAAGGGKWVHFDTNRRGFPSAGVGHDFGHHGVEAAREIMIRNDGTINLYIDAIAPLYVQPQAHGAEAADHPHKR